MLSRNSFSKICRTCLINNELYLIDEVNWEDLNLKEIIQNYTPLELKENDKLPRMMCKYCIKDMYQTYHFLLKCKTSEETILGIIRQESQDELNKQVLDRKVSEIEAYETNGYTENNLVKSESEDVGDNYSDIQYTDDLSDLDAKEFYDSGKEENSTTLRIINNIETEIILNNNPADLGDITELKNGLGDDSEKEENTDALSDIVNVKTEVNHIDIKKVMMRQRQKAQLIDQVNLLKNTDKSRTFLEGPPYKCIRCDSSFQSYEELAKHQIETKHKNIYKTKHKKFICPYCQKEHTYRCMHLEHVRTHTGEKPNKCSACGKCFNLQSVLSRHILTHMEVKPFKCRFCTKQFIRGPYLIDHERKHTGEKLICSFCGKSFQSNLVLSHHEKAHKEMAEHNKEEIKYNVKLFQCDICGKELHSIKTLKEHVLLHGSRDFSCEICERTYITKKKLEDHFLIAHKGMKHLCSICNKEYTRENDLKTHIKSHNEPNIYPCEICKKTFSVKRSLVQHMRIHTGDTKYQCKECLKICTTKRNLVNHLRIHTGDKPFVCNFCGKMYAHEANLKQHMRVHTAEKKKHICEMCGKAFHFGSRLKKHLAIHNKNGQLEITE